MKTLNDLLSLRRTLLFLTVVLAFSVISSKAFKEYVPINLSSLTLAMETQMITGMFVISSFIWIVGIPLVLLASITCGDFISKEYQDGTLLLLISKPIRRWEIIIGKFLAFLLSSLLLESIVLVSSPLIIFYVMDLDIYILETMVRLVPWLITYSVFVAFIFGSIATAFSSMFNNRIKTIVVMVIITILVYFGFTMIRAWTESFGIYRNYGLNFIDMNYHLGNSYLLFLNMSKYRMLPLFQGIMGRFTGTHEILDPERVFDKDIDAMPKSLEPKNYNSPVVSLTAWISISLILLIFGTINFERKEIH